MKYFKINFRCFLFLLLLFLFPAPANAETLEEDRVIAEGVFVNQINVGGKTVANAREALEESLEEAGKAAVTIYWEQTPVTATLGELGLVWAIDEVLEKAAAIGYTGSLIQQYKERQDLRNGHLQLYAREYFEEETLAVFLKEQVAAPNDIAPKDATITRENGGFTVTQHENGKEVNQEKTKQQITDAYANAAVGEALIIQAAVEVSEPMYLTESLQQIQDLIGSSYTVYDDGKASPTRSVNVEVATKHINGKVLNPGETVSTSKLMLERTEKNGYQMGTQFVNNQSEDAIGGGICQASTTLYNALLKAEIQIDDRSNHSVLVTYVDPSKDAVIAEGSKDLVFTNDKEFPIYIEGYTDGTKVYFLVYGIETRPENRKVTFEYEVTYRVKSESITRKDSSLPTGEVKYSGRNSDEVDSLLLKIVTIDGVEVERTELHKDHYEPTYETVTIGTG